ncbi:MAG TPA: cobalamin-dependent protein [Pseudobacteroides sp.]|uniref:B12-binding domain-containing radical SAM protein n=1 Tax=Pseudobacteroides sp. TaxID=1968840 RepID=UPI002F94E912
MLVRPKPHKETIGLQSVMVCEPLELEYLSAALEEEGHETVIVDMILEKKPITYFTTLHKPDAVGITAYISHVNVVKEYAADIKRVDPKITVIVGGVHAEVLPMDFSSDSIDHIVCANGIRTMVQLLEKKVVYSGAAGEESIDGVYQKGKPAVKETGFNYPHPLRSKVSKYRKDYYYMFHRPCALMKTSFGCPFNCSFCFCREVTDHKYFTREIEDMVAELVTLPEDEIYIVDDNFLVDRKRVLLFCELLKKNNINKKFLIYGRADFIAKNEDVIKVFSIHGLRAVIVGLESCDEGELDGYHKNTTVEINERAVSILNKYGIECYGTFILGIEWTKKEFDALLKWIKKLKLCFINLQPFTPMPGTSLFKEYENSIIIPRDEYEKWDMAHLVVKPTNMSQRKYYYNILRVYSRVTLSAGNIIKLVRNYGFFESLRLFPGSMTIAFQYYKKIISG